MAKKKTPTKNKRKSFIAKLSIIIYTVVFILLGLTYYKSAMWIEYNNLKYSFSFKYPKYIEVHEDDGTGRGRFILARPEADHISIVKFKNNSNIKIYFNQKYDSDIKFTDLKDYVKKSNYIDGNKIVYPNELWGVGGEVWKVIKLEEFSIGARKAIKLVIQAEPNQGVIERPFERIYIEGSKTSYIDVDIIRSQDGSDDSVIDSVISTFKFTD